MIEFSPLQKEYWNHANRRWNIKQGATRSGKTYLDYFMIPKRIRATKGNGLLLLLGNTKSTLERNILEPMRNIWTSALVGNISSNNTVNLFGKRCYALGADKISQVSKIQGAGIEYCYGDEMTTWNEEVFQMLKSRLSAPNSCCDGTCNPDSPSHFIKKFLDSDADIFQQRYTIYDNPFLPSSFVKNLEKEYAGTVFFERYILGLWALAEGLVYPMFDIDKHTVSTVPGGGLYYISIDYGTVNPFSMGLWCVQGKVAVRVCEYYYDSKKNNKQKTDEEYYRDLEKMARGKLIQAVVVDPSAASFIECIKRHGRFVVREANNAVLDGIRNTATMLNVGMLKIHESCEDSIREFRSYSWDEKAGEDKVIKENDHAMDDIRYFVQTIMRPNYRMEEWGNGGV